MAKLIKKVNFVKFLLERSNIETIVNKLWLARFGRTNQRYKDTISCRKYFVESLGDAKMYAAELHKVFTHTVDSSQVFKRWFLQKQLKTINKITKNWDKNTIKDLEHVCPK